MKRILLLLTIIFSLATNVNAKTEPGTIKLLSGKIIDKQTGEALAGVKIEIKGTDKYYYTDINGCFTIAISSSTAAEVSITSVGYEPTILKTQELYLGSEIVLNPR